MDLYGVKRYPAADGTGKSALFFKDVYIDYLAMGPSSDDYGPIGYDIYGKKYGDFVLIGSTETTSFTVLKIGHSFLEPESEYTFKVIAVDGNGNESEPSDVLSVITNQRPNFIWYEKEIPPTSAIYFDISYGAGKYVAVGTRGTILSSDDGVNWELDCTGDISDPQFRAVTFGNNRFVAVGATIFIPKAQPMKNGPK